MIRLSRILFISLVTILCLSSCNQPPQDISDQQAIARVDTRVLYKSALDNVIHPETRTEDSTAMAMAFVDQWVRDQLLMREASRYFSSDFDLERLVDDYRERLLKYNLEEKILNERFDTTVRTGELLGIYEDMKEDFLLKESLYRSTFIKFSRKTKSLSQFAKDWKKNDINAIRTFAAAFAEEYSTDTLTWHTWNEIKEQFKSFSKSKADKGESQRQMDKEYEYYLKIQEVVAVRAVAPLGYIAPQLKRMLLHKRKQQLLESYKQELYEKALKNNVIRL